MKPYQKKLYNNKQLKNVNLQNFLLKLNTIPKEFLRKYRINSAAPCTLYQANAAAVSLT